MSGACEIRSPVNDCVGKFGFWCHLEEGLTNQEGFLHGFYVGGESMVDWPAYDFFDFDSGEGNTFVSTVEDDFTVRHGCFKFLPEFEELARPAQRGQRWG